MARFVIGYNNGLAAVLTEKDYLRKRSGQPLESGYFLFLNEPEPIDSLGTPWVLGGRELMDNLLAGHAVVSGGLTVPFSNGAQLYSDRETLLSEIMSIAPMSVVLDTFGVEVTRKRPAAV